MLMAAGTAAIFAAQPPVRQSEPVTTHADGYTSFYPSGAIKTSIPEMPATPEAGSNANRAIAPRLRTASAPANADGPSNIYGYLYFFQGESLNPGMYSIGATSTRFLWADEYTASTMTMQAGWLRDGKVCGLNSLKFMGGTLGYGYIECDLSSGEVLKWNSLRLDADSQENIYISATYRDLDDHVYGYGSDPAGNEYAFNYAPSDNIDASEVITTVPREEVCPSFCYNLRDDLFYGINVSGKFVSITAKGIQTELFSLGIPNLSATATGLVYNPADGLYYFNAYLSDNTSAIYTIDATQKKVTKLYDCPYGEEFIFMVCSDDNVAPTAPARPTSARLNFTGSSLSGTLTATMPGRTVSDAPLSGNLSWKLYIDGEEVKTGSSVAGSAVNIPLDNISNGMHTFALTVGVGNDYSMPATITAWIGSDYPSQPENVTLTETSASWSAVSTGAHNGYVNASDIRYTVYLNDVKVTETSALTCSITMPQGKPYTSYILKVVASSDGKDSEPGLSNYITYGEPIDISNGIHYRPEEYETPLFMTFDIDGTPDNPENPREWHFSTTMGFPSFASGANGEDLIVFPPMNFTETKKAYRFTMEAGLISDIDTSGTIEVLLGTEPTPEAMTQVIIPATRHYHMLGDYVSEYFAVSKPGTYYIGVLTKTNKVAFHISDMDITLTDRDADVPVSVSELSATAGANGALTATVSFTMPTKTASGADIPADATLEAKVMSRSFVPNKPYEGDPCDTKTITGKPGSKQTVEIKTLQNYNTIAVACGINGNFGSEMTETLYTGLQKPYKVENLSAVLSDDNLSVTLTWDPPTESGTSEPGPIGDTFFYSAWYYADGWQFYDGVGWDVTSTTISLEPGTPQAAISLGIMAMNAADQSDYISSLSVIMGEPYKLPMTENFPGYYETYSPIMIQRPTSEYNGTYWRVDDPSEVSPLFSNDSKVAYIGYIGESGVTSAKSRLSLPKFNTTYMKSVNMSLTYWGGPYQAEYSLLATANGMDGAEEVGSFPAGEGWISNSVELPAKFLGKGWVELLLDTKFANDNTFALFSAYSISGIDAVEGVDENGYRIFSTPGMIHVAGLAGEHLTICDIEGRIVASDVSLGDLAGYAVAPGIYIVKAGTKTVKTTVR